MTVVTLDIFGMILSQCLEPMRQRGLRYDRLRLCAGFDHRSGPRHPNFFSHSVLPHQTNEDG
jgi:hypothetical protein